MEPLPLVENMAVPALGLTLVDQGRLDPQVGLDAKKIMLEVFARLIRFRPGVHLCTGVEEGAFLDRNFQAAQRSNPRLTLTEFLVTAPDREVVTDDSGPDPRLQEKVLLVYQGRELLGNFTLYNVILERDDAAGITASAMAIPGCRPAARSTTRATWSAIMRAILENDFTMGGRFIDFIEWRFPSRAGQGWTIAPAEEASVNVDDVVAAVPSQAREIADLEDHEVTPSGDGTTAKIRRVGVTPSAPSILR